MIKPIIKYEASSIPFLVNLTKSVIQKKVNKTTYTTWADKNEFTDYVDTLFAPTASDTYLYIKCHCDEEYTYANKSDVPGTDIDCSCGQKLLEYS